MAPAERYSRLRDCALVREPSATDAREWSEHELQALWFAGSFGRNFTTTDGRAVSVVQFGVWNREAGPDFAEAAVYSLMGIETSPKLMVPEPMERALMRQSVPESIAP